MKHAAAVLLLLAVCGSGVARAQEEAPPRIGPFVVDVRGTFSSFPDAPQLAASRGLGVAELPGLGLGVDVGAHLYLLRWRAITFGIGGEFVTVRAHRSPVTVNGQTFGHAVTERVTSVAPQLSFNFGSGTGWSYLSGGIGRSVWLIAPDGAAPRLADKDRLQTINYGGGARWFAKKRLAFSLDVRFYAINPGMPEPGYPGSPRTTLLVLGAGVAVR